MLRFLPYIILIIVLDQITKFLIVQNFDLYTSYQIFPFLKIIYLQNEGAAFSFLHDAGGWQRYFLILVSVVAVCILPYLIKKNLSNRIVSFALIFILPPFCNFYFFFNVFFVHANPDIYLKIIKTLQKRLQHQQH